MNSLLKKYLQKSLQSQFLLSLYKQEIMERNQP